MYLKIERLMPLQYSLHRNALMQSKSSYYARTEYVRSIDEDALIDLMASRHSGMPKESIRGLVHLMGDVISDQLQAGYKVNLSFVNMALVVKGQFNGADDFFDPNRHEVRLQAATGKKLKRQLANLWPQFTRSRKKSRPLLEECIDVATNSRTHFMPGGMATLIGNNLKVEADDPNQGVFLTNEAGEQTRIATIGQNSPKSLMFLVPATLPAGSYTLSVTNRPNARSNYITGQLETVFTIAP